MAAEPGQAPQAPPAPALPGAGGSGGAQILQQIEALLAQLAEAEPQPAIQQAVKDMAQQAEALQQVVGKDDEQDMQSGLANPSGGGEMPPGGGAKELPAEGGAGMPPDSGAGGDHHGVAEIHIKMGAPKSFGGARKAAMANHAEKGHFSKSTPKGETPQSDRTKNKAKG